LPLTIIKVTPGELWFDDVGTLPVPRRISHLAQTGWMVTAVLTYARERWWLVEVGPENSRRPRREGRPG